MMVKFKKNVNDQPNKSVQKKTLNILEPNTTNTFTNVKNGKRLIMGILFLLFCLSCSSHRKINSTFKDASAFKQGFSGLAVFDTEKNAVVYEKNAEKYFTPASNIKLFTFYTGLMILGDSVPALAFGQRNDTLVFSGTGDPSFLNPDLPSSKVFQFLQKSEKKLFYHPKLPEEAFFGPGWAWDDFNSYYSVERTSFPIYGNRISFKVNPGLTDFEVSPEIFRDSVIIDKVRLDANPEFKRKMAGNQILFTPGVVNTSYRRQVPFKYSSQLLVRLLSDTLSKEVGIIKELPEGLALNQNMNSIQVDSMYKRMMEVSDNFIAEQILLLSSNKIADTSNSRIAIEHMKDTFFQDLPDEVFWVDGSGLSRYNLVTPRSMVKLLRKIYQEVPQERLFNMLATGGRSGTLKNSYIADSPYIFAKTGTLRNNHSLSGFLKAKSGKILIFSFMNSNYTVPTTELKAQMENILRELYLKN